MQFEIPGRIGQANPDAARLAQIRALLGAAPPPVRPLPSNAVLMLACVAVLAALAVLLATPFGFYGLHRLTPAAAAVDYGVLVLLAFVLAGGVVAQMIPGSRLILPPAAAALLSIALLATTASLLFPDFTTREFVRRGLPCLRLGLLCALPGAALVALLLRRGFVTHARQAALAGGALSGLLGVCVLALHCPILNASHIVVWHVGVIAVTSLAGAGAGWAVHPRRPH